MDEISYLYYCRTDGLGFQYTSLSRLLYIASNLHAPVLVDWRQLSFFRLRNQGFSVERLHEFLSIRHPLLIYDPVEIDGILARCPERIFGVRLGKRLGSPHESARGIEFMTIDELYPKHSNKMDCLSSYLKLEGECADSFKLYQQRVVGCVGIHARLSNGEDLKNPIMRQRMHIPYERFFREMDRVESEDFFICTDTPSFLASCIERYGHRVISMPRQMLPEKCGPGHRPGCKKTVARFDGYRLLREALLEMLLLGECEWLICNKSLFTVHARVCRQLESIVVANETTNYSLPYKGS